MNVTVVLLGCLALFGSCWGVDPVVKTAQGLLRGSILKTINEKDIFSFRGVRFAEPPLGPLRFKAPVPPASWEGIRNATEDGAVCPQTDFDDLEGFSKSEDCLFLNVYTTKLPEGRKNPKRSVVVFFHPGGFFSLTGHSLMFGPKYWLDKDIVLVTNNYRLGALGFLSALDPALPGNYGMKDQVQVLRWVKQNIAVFGGNPDSVTIVGYSAGSMSVVLHMMSPMSKGLFHRCVAMSASATKWQTIDPREQAKQQATLLNCPNNTAQEIADCLREKDATDIIATFGGFLEWAWDPMLTFGPVIEPDFGDGAERFLTAEPQKLLLEGKFTQFPLMMGYTTDEFSWKGPQVTANDTWTADINENFEEIAPIAFVYERGTERSRNISRELRNFYLQDQPINNSTARKLGEIYSDALICFPEDRTAKIVSRVSRSPVYFYKFSYAGRFSFITNPPDYTTPYGVVHHDDLIYLFDIPVLFPRFNLTDPEYQNIQRMTEMYTNFVLTGNPTPKKSSLLNNTIWKPFTTQNLNYLDIGSSLEMKQGLNQDRMELWDRLFPIPSISHSRKH